MSELKRQRRRRDLQRMKAKAVRARHWKSPALAIKEAEHLQVCSCWMCGNQRRWQGETLQERRAAALSELAASDAEYLFDHARPSAS